MAVVVNPDGFAPSGSASAMRAATWYSTATESRRSVSKRNHWRDTGWSSRKLLMPDSRAPAAWIPSFRGEVAALGLGAESAQTVGHGIRQSQFRQPFQPVAQSGGG